MVGNVRGVQEAVAAQSVGLESVRVKGASMYPRLPKMFNWRDPVSGEAVLAMWHPRGYGGYSVGEAVTAPGPSLIPISEPTRLGIISYAVFCLKKKNSRL